MVLLKVLHLVTLMGYLCWAHPICIDEDKVGKKTWYGEQSHGHQKYHSTKIRNRKYACTLEHQNIYPTKFNTLTVQLLLSSDMSTVEYV